MKLFKSRIQSNRREKERETAEGDRQSKKFFQLKYLTSFMHLSVYIEEREAWVPHPPFPLLLLVPTHVLKCVNVNQHSTGTETDS